MSEDSDNDERWMNFLLCKVYMTDKEMSDAMPFMLVIVGIIVVIFCVVSCVGGKL